MTKYHTKAPIPIPDDPFTSRPITLNHDWEVFLTGWISDKMSNMLERTHILLSYITTYHKWKLINDLILNNICSWKMSNNFPTILARHSVMTSINHLTISQRKYRSWPCINMDAPVTDKLSGLLNKVITQLSFSQSNMHILHYSTCVERNSFLLCMSLFQHGCLPQITSVLPITSTQPPTAGAKLCIRVPLQK